jgi:hypothetical protein
VLVEEVVVEVVVVVGKRGAELMALEREEKGYCFGKD